jgi:predicted nuclease of predicted toxin-antitoxin system
MLGHEVEFARDIGLAAAPDREIAARVKGNAAALLTRDLDFANIREYPPEDYAGIIVLRLPDDLTARAIGVAVE